MKKEFLTTDISNAWKVNTVALLKEIVHNNDQMAAVAKPLQIFASILYEVAARANELQDVKLTALMFKLSLYEEADPYSDQYNQALCDQVMFAAYPELKAVFETNTPPPTNEKKG